MQMVSSQSLVLTFHNFKFTINLTGFEFCKVGPQNILQVLNFTKWYHKTFYRFRILQSGTTKHFTGFEFYKVGSQEI